MDNDLTSDAYRAPVNQLLSLGKPSGNEWRDYGAMGISSEEIPNLIRMATDAGLHGALGTSNLVWAPVHAWRALGQLRAAEAVAPLLSLLQRIDDFDDDWIASDLPGALAKIGPAALEPAAAYLAEPNRGMWARIAAAGALGKIGCDHPDSRGRCMAMLAAQLEHFLTQSETINAFLICSLLDLKAVELVPLIERAYASGRVDESVVGDLEDVQIELGLKAEREHPVRLKRLHDYELENAKMRREIEAIAMQNALFEAMSDDFEEGPPAEPYIAPPKVGRNDPCPCASGKKYKKCCGA